MWGGGRVCVCGGGVVRGGGGTTCPPGTICTQSFFKVFNMFAFFLNGTDYSTFHDTIPVLYLHTKFTVKRYLM